MVIAVRKRWPVLLAVGSIVSMVAAGCSSDGKKAEPLGTISSDPTIFPKDYKAEVAAFMRTYLGNPRNVRDASIAEPVMRPIGGVNHYVTCVRYNPKDSSDHYQGNQSNMAVFLGGTLIQFIAADPQICSGLTYQRYPEIESMVP